MEIPQKVSEDILKTIFVKRPLNARKYDYGMLTVIGGSRFYSGPPAFSALAAFMVGIDMVRIVAPKRAADIIASFSPNLAAYPLDGDWLNDKHLATLLSLTEGAEMASRKASAIVIGGGAGRSEETKDVIVEYLGATTVKGVIDADALYAVAQCPEIVANKGFVLTPHKGEFKALTGIDLIDLSLEKMIEAVKESAGKLGATILLKGATDIISDGKNVALNEIAVPLMTVGGTGDVLAGIVGALLARGAKPFEAACAGVYINCKAGLIAGNEIGEGMTAMNVIDKIKEVIPKFEY